MQIQTHPVIRALRDICSMNLPQYEAIIALMQEHFFSINAEGRSTVNQVSIHQFLTELHDEKEICYSREAAFSALMESGNNPALVKALFGIQSQKK